MKIVILIKSSKQYQLHLRLLQRNIMAPGKVTYCFIMQIVAQANNGQFGKFKAILDSGSKINIVTERLVNKLKIKPSETCLKIEGIA